VTEELAEEIRKDAEAGMSCKELIKKYKVNIKDSAKIFKGEESKEPAEVCKQEFPIFKER
jgi:Mor family transcriptional regulator